MVRRKEHLIFEQIIKIDIEHSSDAKAFEMSM